MLDRQLAGRQRAPWQTAQTAASSETPPLGDEPCLLIGRHLLLLCLEEPEEAPEELRWTVLRIGWDAEDGLGSLTFSEV